MVAALTSEGITALMTVRGGVRAKSFERFVRQRLVPTLRPGDIVAWDNLNLHKRRDLVAAVEAVGATVLFLPRYSPDLNPIEPAWGKAKAWIRKHQPRTVAKLRELIRRSLRRIKPSDAEGWIRYAGYALPNL